MVSAWRNRKGFLYVIMAILLLGVGIISVKTQDTVMGPSPGALHARIIGLNNLIVDIERDLEHTLDIAAFRALFAITDWETIHGTFLPDMSSSFSSLLNNGSIGNDTLVLMENNTLLDWSGKIQAQAWKQNALMSLNLTRVEVFHQDPWSVVVRVSGVLSLQDQSTVLGWVRNVTVNRSIDIQGFEDPTYSVLTGGYLQNTVRQSNITQFVSGSDVTALGQHANNSWYVAHADAPSFLQRLAGNLSPSDYGIESMVNIDVLELRGGVAKPGYQTVIDHLYFGNYSGSGNIVTGMPSWFKIDAVVNPATNLTHLEEYQVEGLV